MAKERATWRAGSWISGRVVCALLVFAGCYLGSLAGTQLVFPRIGTAVLFYPYAVLAAALILRPAREWWLYILAGAAGNFWPHLSFERSAGFVLMTEAANVIRAAVAAGGVRWLCRREDSHTLRGAVVFIAFAVVLGPACGALAGAAAVVSHQAGASFGTVWRAWMLSNVLTGLTLLPLILIVCTRAWRGAVPVQRFRVVEAAVLFSALLATGAYVFITSHGDGIVPAELYAPLPLLIWAAARFGPVGMVAALSTLTALAIGGALRGGGPFVALSPAENLLQLQSFLIALCAPLLLLSAMAAQQGRTAAALEQSRADYRAVVEDQTELICRFLPDGTYTFVNSAYCRYFERTPDQLLGRAFWQFVPGEAQAAGRAHLASITADAPVKEIEHPVTAPDGQTRWQHWTNRGLFNEHGDLVGFQAVGRDVTERRDTEAALRAANNELGLLKDRLQAENAYLHGELSSGEHVGGVICKSQAMRQALADVQRVAPTDVTVLVLGETGAGKEVIARAVHQGSGRKDRPFVRLNCAALPASLIESELFGHERGAFTGATHRRLGRFEVANDATLFLDEIGELPLEVQSKLLRVLQENEFERLGSSDPIRVNVRLIAATSRDLEACVQSGSFRADLYYRLNVFPVVVPPLRARREDIVPLATSFLHRIGRQLGRTFAPLSSRTAESLMQHRWPGNVRELEHLIERAAICSRGTVLTLPEGWNAGAAHDLQSELSAGRARAAVGGGTGNGFMTIEKLERGHIIAVLEHTKWRIEGPAGAAVILGIKPSTLRFRMKKLSISRTAASSR